MASRVKGTAFFWPRLEQGPNRAVNDQTPVECRLHHAPDPFRNEALKSGRVDIATASERGSR